MAGYNPSVGAKMAFASGTRLGPYEIISLIGAGGMGEVYRARDTRLERTVAIKVLSTLLSSDQRLRQRFELEARTISSLNHPHICTLYDVGHENGTDFLVMEFLEGESLADRVRRGALPLGDVVQIGIEVVSIWTLQHHPCKHRVGAGRAGNALARGGTATLLRTGRRRISMPAGLRPRSRSRGPSV